MIELLILLGALAGLAIVGVCLWGVNLALDALDPDAWDDYHDTPYR